MAVQEREVVISAGKESTQPSGPKGHWLLGNTQAMASDPLGMLADAPRYGRLPRFRFLNNVAWLAYYPEDVKHVLVDNQRNYIKGYGLQALKPILGEGLLTSEPPKHTEMRRMIQPAFHRQRIAAYAEIMTAYTTQALDGWRTDVDFDLHHAMMELTMLIVAKCLFDADVSNEADNLGATITSMVEAFDMNRVGPIGQFLEKFDRPRVRQREQNKATMDALLLRLIRERRAEGKDHGDLLSMILAMSDEEEKSTTGAGMSDEQARDELITLFIAGHETTAIALSWTFYYLAQHPEVETRLLEEIHRVLGNPAAGTARLPTFADVEQLAYTRQVFSEAMRINPPAYATARIALADDVIGGQRVKRGETVIVSQWVTHRDARWWPEPERFDPDRFAPAAEADRPKFAYFPFGGGARRCVGEPFAWMEGVLLLATIVQRYHLELVEGFEPGIFPRITLRPGKGMEMIARSRT